VFLPKRPSADDRHLKSLCRSYHDWSFAFCHSEVEPMKRNSFMRN
jgi:hypothetical protein